MTAHAELLRALLPLPYGSGPSPHLVAELDVEARALDAALALADTLLAEMDPRSTTMLLSEWERMAGLPDSCVASAGAAQTVQQRQAALTARLCLVGGQSKGFFIALAATLGYAITITDWWDFPGGIGDPAQGIDTIYTWRINAASTNVSEFRAGANSAGDSLRTWGNEVLECVMNRFKPAHTVLLFGYSG